jgi:predicted metalloprotease with PDZ domain
LYNKYYKQKGRGFTEDEFRKESESIAGAGLSDFFDYIYTLKPVNYSTYLNYAGLVIDTIARELPVAWSGARARDRNDTLWLTEVEWKSPAWDAGLRSRQALLSVNGKKMNAREYNEILASSKPGDAIELIYLSASGQRKGAMTLRTKKESSYAISIVDKPDPLQAEILKSWFGDK